MSFKGISVALVTPLNEAGSLDDSALERLLGRVVDAGVVAVCPGGTTGEGPRLTRDFRVELVRRCVEQVPSTLPIVGSVLSSSVAETLSELEAQARAGARAALVTPPTRMPLGPRGCREFYSGLAQRSPIPLVIYHIPAFTGVHLPPELVVELAAMENIIALKDSGGDLQYHLRVADGLAAAAIADFQLLTGTDAMIPASMQAGGAGAIIASANLVPGMSVALHRAVGAGEVASTLDLQQRLRAIVVACRRGSLPAGWKAALELAGVCSARPVPPGEALDLSEVEALRDDLERLGVLS